MSHTLELTQNALPPLRDALPDDYWEGELVSRNDLRANSISVNPERMSGTPCFVGTRVSYQRLLDGLPEVTRDLQPEA